MRVTLSTGPCRQKEVSYASSAVHYGLLSVASAAANQGHETSLIDANVLGLDVSATVSQILATAPDVVGLSSYTYQIRDVEAVARGVKNANPGTCIVVGGVHPSIRPRETLSKCDAFDYALVGEGEEAFPQLLHSLEVGEELALPSGILNRTQALQSGPAVTPALVGDLDSIPTVDWRFFPERTEFPILTSRGCKARCTFCFRALGGEVRYRSIGSVLDEVDRIAGACRVEKLSFYDQTFEWDRRRLFVLLDAFIARDYPAQFYWVAGTRAELVDHEVAAKFRESGCEWVCLGAESPIDAQLASARKGSRFEQVKQAISCLRSQGIKVALAFLLGLPGESLSTLEYKSRVIPELDAQHISVNVMIPYPGTRLYDDAIAGRNGYALLSRDYADYVEGTMLYAINGLSSVELHGWKLSIRRELEIRNKRLVW